MGGNMAKFDVEVPKSIKKQVTNPEAHITACKIISSG